MKQKIFAVAAMGKNRVVGKQGKLPWPDMKCDYERLLELSGNSPTIMGRSTFESPQRFLSANHNLILTRQTQLELPSNCSLVSSAEEALNYYQNELEICILGGGSVYTLFLPKCTHLYITLIHTEAEGDAYFPSIPEKEWVLTEQRFFSAGAGNPLDYAFLTYLRTGGRGMAIQ